MTNSRVRTARHVLIATIGSTVYNLSQWLLLIVLARLATQEVVGLYSYTLAVTAPLALLFGLNLRRSYVTEDLNIRTFVPYYRLRIGTSMVLSLLILVMAIALDAGGIVLLAVGLAKTIDLLTDFLLAPLQKSGNLAAIGKVQALNGTATLGFATAFLMATSNAHLALSATVLGSFLALAYTLKLLRDTHPDIRRQLGLFRWRTGYTPIARLRRGKLLLVLLPLGFAAGLASARVTLPRYLLEAYWGLEDVGIYSAALHITVAANALVGAVAQLALPKFVSILRSRGARALRKPVFITSLLWLCIGVVVTGLAYVFGPWLLETIYGSDYVADGLMWVLAIAWGVSSAASMAELGLLAQRKFNSQLYVNLLAFTVTLGASIALVPSSGMIGAGWAGVISATMLFAFNAVYFLFTSRGQSQTQVASD